jgi:AbrB family looped-hinge helix DNA binding protein
MKAVVAERGQVTIPKALRQRLGIRPKTVLDFREENGVLVARKAVETDPVTEVLGCLKLSRSTDAILEDLRGKP